MSEKKVVAFIVEVPSDAVPGLNNMTEEGIKEYARRVEKWDSRLV